MSVGLLLFAVITIVNFINPNRYRLHLGSLQTKRWKICQIMRIPKTIINKTVAVCCRSDLLATSPWQQRRVLTGLNTRWRWRSEVLGFESEKQLSSHYIRTPTSILFLGKKRKNVGTEGFIKEIAHLHGAERDKAE